MKDNDPAESAEMCLHCLLARGKVICTAADFTNVTDIVKNGNKAINTRETSYVIAGK